MKTISSVLFSALVLSGCLSATVSVNSVCSQKDISFDTSSMTSSLNSQFSSFDPNGISDVCNNQSQFSSVGPFTVPEQTTTVNFDFSGSLKDVSKVASDFHVQITQLSLSNPTLDGGSSELSFVSSVEIDVQGVDDMNNPNPSFPSAVLATYTAPSSGPGSELDFTIQMPPDQVLSYLKGTKVQLTLKLDSNPITLAQACSLASQTSLDTTVHMCVSVSASINKSL